MFCREILEGFSRFGDTSRQIARQNIRRRYADSTLPPPAFLTKRTIDGLRPKAKDYFVWDEELRCFGVRVLRTGRKTFYVQYRSGGRTRRVKVGSYGAVTADQARGRAKELLGDVASGKNPAEDIRTYRRASTVATICERFLSEHAAVRCKPSTQMEYRRAVDLFIKPKMGPRKISDIIRADVAELHHDLRDKPYQANRVLGVLSKMFNLSEVWGLRPDGSNPCRHVPKYPERKRERFLSPDEISELSAVLAEAVSEGLESPQVAAAFQLLLLTGCRLREVQTLRWDYIEGNYINLPDSKTGARKIPLSPAIRSCLETIPREPENPYVIIGNKPGQHITDLQHPWQRIRARAGLPDVRIHDLRHTYASNAVAAGQPLEMIGKLLGHTQIQTTQRYAHLADAHVQAAAARVSGDIDRAMTEGQNRARKPAPRPAVDNVVYIHR